MGKFQRRDIPHPANVRLHAHWRTCGNSRGGRLTKHPAPFAALCRSVDGFLHVAALLCQDLSHFNASCP